MDDITCQTATSSLANINKESVKSRVEKKKNTQHKLVKKRLTTVVSGSTARIGDFDEFQHHDKTTACKWLMVEHESDVKRPGPLEPLEPSMDLAIDPTQDKTMLR